jgi:hypothetical protein
MNRTSADVKPRGECTLDVVENMLDKRQVRLTRGMHEEAHLLNNIQ